MIRSLKKLLLLTLSLLLVALSMVACGKEEKKTETTAAVETTAKEVETQKETKKEEKSLNSDIKVSVKETDKKTSLDVVCFGKYDADIGRAGDIEWLVLDKNNNSYLLLSRYIIFCKNYNDKDEKVSWEDASLNEWLNNYFLNSAFSTDEIAYMNPVNEFGLDGKKKVGLLNVAACRKYFGKEDKDKTNYRLSAEATAWAISNWEEVVDKKESKYYGCGSFHLSDNGDAGDKAAWVGQYGRVREDGQFVKLNHGDGVRPVIVVKKELLTTNLEVTKAKETEVVETVANEKEVETEEETSESAKKSVDKSSNVYSNKAKEKILSTTAPSSEKNVIDLGRWEYGRTPIIWIYVEPNKQIICNNSPNRSENFSYKAQSSSGSKGCYMPIFSRGDSYGDDWDGRLYSFDDYKKTTPEEMKFDTKFVELKYGDYNVKDLLSKKYDLEEVTGGVYKANGTYINVIYVSELDEIIANY